MVLLLLLLLVADLCGEAVDAVSEADDAGDLARLPGLDGVEGAHEHFVEPEGVGARGLDDVVGVDDVSPRLGHLLAVGAEDHALVDELLEGFLGRDDAGVEEDLVPEARVEQMQDGVLRASDVQVDGEPGPFDVGVDQGLGIQVVGEAQIVPARPGPLGHRVRLPGVEQAVAVEKPPVGGPGEAPEGVRPRRKVLHLRQRQRQLVEGHGDRRVVPDVVLRLVVTF
mmetsp:Transcript_21672/g.69794  ORF Transcript_21672/g.69794 Transcript_21672/m.69794 type:complete len:225 (-) Transcript_21672:1582-2256(-)